MPNYFGGYSPPQQFMQYQQPQQNNTVTVATVQGEAGARIYPVAAGNTVFLVDFDAHKFWLKSTDVNGMPSRFAAFTFTEEVTPQVQGDIVTRNEFNDLKKSIDAQFKQLIDTIKGANQNDSNNATIFEPPANV